MLYHEEPIWREGVRVGRTTSGMYGHTLGGSVGLGYVECPEGVDQEFIASGNFELEVAGKRFVCCRKPSADVRSDGRENQMLRGDLGMTTAELFREDGYLRSCQGDGHRNWREQGCGRPDRFLSGGRRSARRHRYLDLRRRKQSFDRGHLQGGRIWVALPCGESHRRHCRILASGSRLKLTGHAAIDSCECTVACICCVLLSSHQ